MIKSLIFSLNSRHYQPMDLRINPSLKTQKILILWQKNKRWIRWEIAMKMKMKWIFMVAVEIGIKLEDLHQEKIRNRRKEKEGKRRGKIEGKKEGINRMRM